MNTIALIAIVAGVGWLWIQSRAGPTTSSASDLPTLRLDTLVNSLREQLIAMDSVRVERNEEPLFKLKQFTIEVNFVLRRIAEEKGGVNYVPVVVEASQSLAREHVQRVTLEFDIDTTVTRGRAVGGGARPPN